jgi:hypothetical protein
MAKDGSSAKNQVRPGIVQTFVNYEIFLFPTKRCGYFCDVLVEIIANINRRLIKSFKCF